MAINRPQSFWFVFWTETSRCVYTCKKYPGRSAAILAEQAWPIKDMVLLRDTACNQERTRFEQDSILSARVDSLNAGFGSPYTLVQLDL